MSKRLLSLSVLLALIAVGHPAASEEQGTVHLPDLRPLTPSEFRIGDADGRRVLRLSNTVWNAGEGPLEVRPENDPAAGVTHAHQQLFTHDTQGGFEIVAERSAGSFEFHADHDHWHLQDFARYSLHEVADDGSPGLEIAASDKIGFCLFDQYAIDGDLEHALTSPHYRGSQCDNTGGQDAPQGYSVGWGDEYAWSFAGQWIDLTGVSDGTYWVVSTTDFSNVIEETVEDNNSARVRVRLEGDVVSVVTRIRGRICAPCGRERLVVGRSYELVGSLAPPEAAAELSFSYARAGSGRFRAVGTPNSSRAFTSPSGGSVAVEDGQFRVTFTARKLGGGILRFRCPKSARYTGSVLRLPVRVVRR